MPLFENPWGQDSSLLKRFGRGIGIIKEEPKQEPVEPFFAGDVLKLLEVNTRQVMVGTVESIDPYGRIKVRFKDSLIPRYFDDARQLQEEIKATQHQGAAIVRRANQAAPNPEPKTLFAELNHQAYTVLGGRNQELPYGGRVRITSKTESVQAGVYMPETLEDIMEAIVVDYEKDEVLRHYLETDLLPFILKQRIKGKLEGHGDVFLALSKKIHDDFPYQRKMLDKGYAKKNYPPGKKVYLGKLMQEQDMICRHMALLFAASVDYLKKNVPGNSSGISKDCDVRYMADMQKDVVENERDGHAYAVMHQHGRYYVADPTSGMAKEVHEILASRSDSHSKYRYLFSAARFLIEQQSPESDVLLVTLIRAGYQDPKLAGLVTDLQKALVRDPLASYHLTSLKERAKRELSW